jgi:uncharacterized NAD(P)/FAD-binding protein YdhS
MPAVIGEVGRMIAIVGAGASGLALIYAYVQHYTDDAGMPNTVFVFEKSGVFGPGVAYEQDLSTNILNTKTGFITPFQDRPGDFYNWLNANERIWKPSFPHYRQQKDNYAPRPLFGIYLKSRFDWIVDEAAARGITVIRLGAEVIDIVPIGDKYGISTRCNKTLIAQHVLLACGTVPAGRRLFGETPETVFHNPYPLSTLSKAIPKHASIAILGARLSCIDAVRGLVHEGHHGSISIHSRSGYFPSVRGSQGRLSLKVFTADGIRALSASRPTLQIEDLVSLALEENAAQGGDAGTVFSVPKPPSDIIKYLEDEILASSQPRLWQAILYATNSFIDVAWGSLSSSEQERLKKGFMSAFMSHRVSFPVENAKSILGYLRAGTVKFIPGRFTAEYGYGGRPHKIKMSDGSERSYDYVVWATGSPLDARHSESLLVQNLLDQGLVSAHPMGGLRVDPETRKVIDRNGRLAKSVRLVGELSNGEFFFTSALEILVEHSRRCVGCLVDELKTADTRRQTRAIDRIILVGTVESQPSEI